MADSKKLEIFDWNRLLLGDLPGSFLLEIGFRTFAMYIFLLIAIRFVGKRSMGQLSPFEFSLIIALGSSAGDPMFYEDVPVLHGFLVIAIVIFIQQILAKITEKNKKIESLVEGKARCLIREGIIQTGELNNEQLSCEELLSGLRELEVESLGEIKRAYIESNGKISIFRFKPKKIRPGLSTLPEEENQQKYKSGQRASGYCSCSSCGKTMEMNNNLLADCPECHGETWEPAVLPDDDE